MQIAYAVADVHAAVEHWQHQYGAGPFVVREHIQLDSVRIERRAGVFDHSSAYGQWGDVMVELVQQHTAPVGQPVGLHHMAFFVDDLQAAQERLIAAGLAELLFARVAGGTTAFAFHDARHELGHLVEIYEGTPRLREFYAHIRSLADR